MKINEIPQVEYIGYLWFDNSDTPEQIDGEYDFSKITSQPFIIEGNLKAKDGTISVSIRYLDGEYIIIMVEWDKVEANVGELFEHVYIAHGFGAGKIIRFTEAWLPEPEPYCENMETLRPAWIAFNGFGKHEEA